MAAYHAAPRHQPPLVCFIPLFDAAARIPEGLTTTGVGRRQIVPLILTTISTYATREGVARRLKKGHRHQGCDAPWYDKSAREGPTRRSTLSGTASVRTLPSAHLAPALLLLMPEALGLGCRLSALDGLRTPDLEQHAIAT